MDEDPAENKFSSAEQAFIEGLRQHADRWPKAGAATDAYRHWDGGTLLKLDLASAGKHLLTIGAMLRDDHVRGDLLHTCADELINEPTSLYMEHAAAPADLVAPVAEWFYSVLIRPVERLEWWHRGRPYAARYQFADTKEGLLECYARQLAPFGQYWRLLRKRSYRGRRWIKTAGIGPADRTIAVRAEGAVMQAPEFPAYLWYECPMEPGPATLATS